VNACLVDLVEVVGRKKPVDRTTAFRVVPARRPEKDGGGDGKSESRQDESRGPRADAQKPERMDEADQSGECGDDRRPEQERRDGIAADG
jgi:hypothetical protein